jgi:polymorphic membrane protein
MRQQSSQRIRRSFRPHFEVLEDRCVPASIVVDTLVDEVTNPTTTSLREAIAQARSSSEDDSIRFDSSLSGTIKLAQGELLIGNLYMPPNSGELTIDGGTKVTLDAGGASRVLDIQSGTVTLIGMTLTNGYGDLGGGLMVWDGATVTLENSTVSNCKAKTAGGGIFNIGTLTLTNTKVSNNYSSSSGGGVYNDGGYGGNMTATGSTFSGNEARQNGGAIFNVGGGLSITTSTFAGNRADFGKGNDIYIYNTISDDLDIHDNLSAIDIVQEVSKPKGGGRK